MRTFALLAVGLLELQVLGMVIDTQLSNDQLKELASGGKLSTFNSFIRTNRSDSKCEY